MSPSLLLVAGLVLAATIGWSVNEGGLCAVAATREMVLGHRPRLLAGSVLAASVAGVLLLPTAWTVGPAVRLVGSADVGGALIVGAMLLGLGAVINDACLLGSLARLGDGELRFLAMPLGIATGFALTTGTVSVHPSAMTRPGAAGLALVALFAVLLVAAFVWLRKHDARLPHRRWRLATAMIVLGIAGGALYALAPGWTWSDAIRRNLPFAMGMNDGGAGTALAAATVAGSMAAALRDRRFRPRLPTVRQGMRSFVGGAIMAVGAAHVPGGNDSLLLAALPSASLSGTIAYAVMTLTAAALAFVVVDRREKPVAPRP